jgi:uncharacterized membrane protein
VRYFFWNWFTQRRLRLGDVAVFENRQSGTAAKFINKSLLFIQLLGVIRQPELKSINVDEDIF